MTPEIGKIQSGKTFAPGYRDAVHTPIILAIVSVPDAVVNDGYDEEVEDGTESMTVVYLEARAGAPVRFVNETTVSLSSPETSDGIIDPFLQEAVPSGRRVWIFLNPGSVTKLRHHFETPKLRELSKKDLEKEGSFLRNLSDIQQAEECAGCY